MWRLICATLFLASLDIQNAEAQTADLSVEMISLTEPTIRGGMTEYLITARNNGPDDAPGTRVWTFPSLFCHGHHVSCTTTGGAICASNNQGLLFVDELLDLPVGSSVTYNWVCRVSSTGGNVLLTSSRATPDSSVLDPDSANNHAPHQEPVLVFWVDGFESDPSPPN